MICVVLCYWQRAAYQQLARAVQTEGVGMVRLMVGERRLTVHERREAGWRGWPVARAVVPCVARAVTHILRTRTISPTHRTARTPHICEPLRTYAARTPYHAPTGSSPAHPPSCTLHAFYCQAHRFSLLMLAFVLRTYAKRRIFAPV